MPEPLQPPCEAPQANRAVRLPRSEDDPDLDPCALTEWLDDHAEGLPEQKRGHKGLGLAVDGEVNLGPVPSQYRCEEQANKGARLSGQGSVGERNLCRQSDAERPAPEGNESTPLHAFAATP